MKHIIFRTIAEIYQSNGEYEKVSEHGWDQIREPFLRVTDVKQKRLRAQNEVYTYELLSVSLDLIQRTVGLFDLTADEMMSELQ